jgi:D-amino peptidase
MMVQELEESFDAMMMVGYHSWAGSGADPLAHTITGGIIYIQINDMYVSEFILNAYTAGLVKVPVVFVSGDTGICEQAESFIPAIKTVAVKHGVGNSTVSIHPHLAVERIRESVQEVLEVDVSKCQVRLPKHFSVEIKYKEHSKAYKSSFYPGVTLKEPTVIQFEADDYYEILRAILFVV